MSDDSELNYEFPLKQESHLKKRKAATEQTSTSRCTVKSTSNARKLKQAWDEREESQLILAVQNRPTLYDCGDPTYKDRNVKVNAWKEVANEIDIAGVDAEEAKHKWNALRNKFKMQLSRYRARKSGQGADEINVNEMKHPHFHAMMFVESTDIQRSTSSTSTMHLDNAITDQSLLMDFSPEPQVKFEPRRAILPRRSRADPIYRKRAATQSTSTQTPPSSPAPSSRNVREMVAQVLAKLNAKLDPRSNDAIDDYSAFVQNIVRHLRSLERHQALQLEILISQTMYKYLESISSLSRASSTMPNATFVDTEGNVKNDPDLILGALVTEQNPVNAGEPNVNESGANEATGVQPGYQSEDE